LERDARGEGHIAKHDAVLGVSARPKRGLLGKAIQHRRRSDHKIRGYNSPWLYDEDQDLLKGMIKLLFWQIIGHRLVDVREIAKVLDNEVLQGTGGEA
jgi:hypothetical protein